MMIDSGTQKDGAGSDPDTAPTPRYHRSDMQSTDIDRRAQQIGLIRSIAAYATGREDAALDEIRHVLAGATIDDLLARRAA